MSSGPVQGAGPTAPRTLILGDSLIKHLERDLHIPGLTVICSPGATIHSLQKTFREMETLSPPPDKIFLHVGTNSICKVVLHRALKDMQRLVCVVQDRYPGSEIIVNKILPRYDRVELDDCRYYYNIELHKYIGNNARTASAGCDIPEHLYHDDGLHLSRSGGYQQFAHDVHEVISHVPTLKGKYSASMVPPLLPQRKKKKKHVKEAKQEPKTTVEPKWTHQKPKWREKPSPAPKEDTHHGPGFVMVTNTSEDPIILPILIIYMISMSQSPSWHVK